MAEQSVLRCLLNRTYRDGQGAAVAAASGPCSDVAMLASVAAYDDATALSVRTNPLGIRRRPGRPRLDTLGVVAEQRHDGRRHHR